MLEESLSDNLKNAFQGKDEQEDIFHFFLKIGGILQCQIFFHLRNLFSNCFVGGENDVAVLVSSLVVENKASILFIHHWVMANGRQSLNIRL